MVKNLPTNAGDMGSIPGGESPHARRHLSPHTKATACVLEPTLHDERSPHLCATAPTLTGEKACSPHLEKARMQQRRPSTAEDNFCKSKDAQSLPCVSLPVVVPKTTEYV